MGGARGNADGISISNAVECDRRPFFYVCVNL